ncbi:MAG: hypothetical protein J6Y19_10425 [Kiritimatiellae bacterium]|nr:hypothetical protein [Kiritimatiellia bacterium]
MTSMEAIEALRIHSVGRQDGIPFSLSHIPAPVLQSILNGVQGFIAGSEASPRTKSQIANSLIYSISEGSLNIRAGLTAVMASFLADSGFANDVAAIAEGRLGDVSDAGRLETICNLRQDLLDNGADTIELSSPVASVPAFDLVPRDLVPAASTDPWVDSEAYVMATVVDIGGKSKPNAHLELDNGKTIVADSTRQDLANIKENLLYKDVLAHIAYQVDLKTQAWRGIRLVSLSLPAKPFDPEAFDRAVSAPSAWDEVEDPVTEIRRMRGAHA